MQIIYQFPVAPSLRLFRAILRRAGIHRTWAVTNAMLSFSKADVPVRFCRAGLQHFAAIRWSESGQFCARLTICPFTGTTWLHITIPGGTSW
jgi:hypothetical protein